MQVFLNSNALTLDENSMLIDLLETQGMAEKNGIAVAINNHMITRSKWQETLLHENDKIIIISATKGG